MVQSGNYSGNEAIESLRAILQKPNKSDLDVARGISIIEEGDIGVSSLQSLIENQVTSGVKRVGITGAPGVGKSTFLNMLISTQDLSNYKVAIVAVDPSSRRTRGALLGDRIRIRQNTVFEEIYFRSMATRGAYGGLNDAIGPVLFFLSNCGFTLIFIETVGVGQNEVQVAEFVDQVIYVLDSNSGDEVQMEKAGIMEIGDIYFVNNRDNKVNKLFISNLEAFLSSSVRVSGNKPSLVIGSALSGEGIEEITRQLNLNLFGWE
jgi:LAO/AO transport system kinase